MALDEKIEIIDLPQEGTFKVVQLLFDEKPIMLCGYSYHADILENYLRSKEIRPHKMTIRKMLEEKEIPVLTGERYKVVGMGLAEIKQQDKIFQLPFDESGDYGIQPNYDFREQLRKQFVGWKFSKFD
ncbi:MAG: hypothetical protein WCI72_04745 [archaeon]